MCKMIIIFQWFIGNNQKNYSIEDNMNIVTNICKH